MTKLCGSLGWISSDCCHTCTHNPQPPPPHLSFCPTHTHIHTQMSYLPLDPSESHLSTSSMWMYLLWELCKNHQDVRLFACTVCVVTHTRNVIYTLAAATARGFSEFLIYLLPVGLCGEVFVAKKVLKQAVFCPFFFFFPTWFLHQRVSAWQQKWHRRGDFVTAKPW